MTAITSPLRTVTTPPPMVTADAAQPRDHHDQDACSASAPAHACADAAIVLPAPAPARASAVSLQPPVLPAYGENLRAFSAPSLQALRQNGHLNENANNGPLPARLGLCKVVVRDNTQDDSRWTLFHTNPVCLERASNVLAAALGPQGDLVMHQSVADADTWRIFLQAAHDLPYDVPVAQMLPLSILLRELNPPETWGPLRALQDLCLRNVDDAAQRDELLDLFTVACERGESDVCNQIAQKISAKAPLQAQAVEALSLANMQRLLTDDHLVCPEDQVADMAHRWLQRHAPDGSDLRSEAQRTLRACVRWAHVSEMGVRNALSRGLITYGEAGRLFVERTCEAEAPLPSLFGESTDVRAYLQTTSVNVTYTKKGHCFAAEVTIPDFARRWEAMNRGLVQAICSEPFTAHERRWRVVVAAHMVGVQLISGADWHGSFGVTLRRPTGKSCTRKADTRLRFNGTTDTHGFAWRHLNVRTPVQEGGCALKPWLFADGSLRIVVRNKRV